MKASIFTRITNREILNWIQDQSQSAPLLMVVGGYNGTTALNDVELISTQGKKCVKPIRPIGEVRIYFCSHHLAQWDLGLWKVKRSNVSLSL